MEGGLNSPLEILEPVGKPQLFKCRKSWFYKMLIWSVLGTSEQNGSEKQAPSDPPFIYSAEWSKGVKERRRGTVTKGGRRKRSRMRRWRNVLFHISFTSGNPFFTLNLLVDSHRLEKKHHCLIDGEGWQDISMLNITLSFLLFRLFLYASHFPFLKIYHPPISMWPHGNFRGLRNYNCLPSLSCMLSLSPSLSSSLSLFPPRSPPLSECKVNLIPLEHYSVPLLFFDFHGCISFHCNDFLSGIWRNKTWINRDF